MDKVYSLDFSPDGQLLASGSADGNVVIWKASTGSLLYKLEGHTDEVSSVSFSPNGDSVNLFL